MKQTSGPNVDLKPDKKKTLNRTTLNPITDTNSQAPTI